MAKFDRPTPKKEILIDALDLIKRQKAEIEQYKARICNDTDYIERIEIENRTQKAEIRKYKNCYEQVKWERDLFEEHCKTAKAEAIKEFGKLLIDKAYNGVVHIGDLVDYVNYIIKDEETTNDESRNND